VSLEIEFIGEFHLKYFLHTGHLSGYEESLQDDCSGKKENQGKNTSI